MSPTPRRIVALAGGVGAARFLRGLVRAVDPGELTVVANTGDDLVVHGLRISPDVDTVVYTLGGGIDEARGWGRAEDPTTVQDELASRYGEPTWFTLGDRDLATHVLRTAWLAEGATLSEATAALAEAWGLGFTLRPMSDERVTTRIDTEDGRDLHFQQWWVGERGEPGVAGVRFDGADQAVPAPGVLGAVAAADAVILCPSNPVVSISPILALPGVRAALRATPTVGVSPVVGGRVLRGMADRLLPVVGCRVDAADVAGLYRDLLDGWVLDEADANRADAAAEYADHVAVTDTMLAEPDAAQRVAEVVLDVAGQAMGTAS